MAGAVCRGCERTGTKACEETFFCRVCREEKRVCWSQVGGFGDSRLICAACHFHRHTGRALVNKYTNHRVLRENEDVWG